ncbi:RNA polymerase subunit sigma-70 [Kitasatospora sp. NPDC088134]|uniref:RNA polymerase subunit sigma-70 n=1 Tax=Kitasatospora sp. NPDC088134 TaxID=3364071 RepID=UPI0037F9D044
MSGISSAAGSAAGSAAEDAADLELARAGDAAAFTRLVAPLRGELHAHCYRMLGSGHDADDALQEALLRAWRGIGRFEGRAGRASLRAWLYTAATRTCLDAVEHRGRRALPVDLGPAAERVVLDAAPATEVAWLGPYPSRADPAERYQRREDVELAFVAALQHLPGNQRAALLLFEVLGFSAAEIADLLDTTAGSVNSALARARRQLARTAPDRDRQPAPDGPAARAAVAAYRSALERGDADALVALLSADATWSMPPLPHWYRGRAAVAAFARAVPFGRCPSWRTAAVEANGRPAVACWLGAAPDAPHTAWSVTVLGLDGDGLIAELVSFLGAEHFAAFGLPERY